MVSVSFSFTEVNVLNVELYSVEVNIFNVSPVGLCTSTFNTLHFTINTSIQPVTTVLSYTTTIQEYLITGSSAESFSISSRYHIILEYKLRDLTWL